MIQVIRFKKNFIPKFFDLIYLYDNEAHKGLFVWNMFQKLGKKKHDKHVWLR